MLIDLEQAANEARESAYWKAICDSIPLGEQMLMAEIVQRACFLQAQRGGEIAIDPVFHVMNFFLFHARICPLKLTDFLHGDPVRFVPDYVAITTQVHRDARDWSKAYLLGDHWPFYATKPRPVN